MKNAIYQYSSFVLISHIVFALPFALVGYVLAIESGYQFDARVLISIFFCMFFARNAAMSFNRIVDATIDERNPRTQKREIPQRIISRRNASIFCVANATLFIVTTYFINELCFFLSFIALSVVFGYSYMKRITYLSHFILGLGLSLAPLGAYIATTGHFSIMPILFSFVVFFWVAGFDILYALQDEDFDKQNCLYSIPAIWGYERSVQISRWCHVVSFLLICGIGYFLSSAHFFYWLGCLFFGTMMVTQHLKILKRNILLINKQFLIFNGWASILFFIFFYLNHLYNG